MIDFHKQSGADLTVACMEVSLEEAKSFGVMSLNEQARIVDFHEKPAQPNSVPGDPEHALASMGVYVFSTEHLIAALTNDHERQNSKHDFGKDIIPSMIESQNVFAYQFGGDAGRVSPDRYWRDVGTIDSYYTANMDLLKPVPPLNLYQQDWPVRTYSGQHPPARTAPGSYGAEGISINSISSSGTVITGGSVQNSILFNNVFVDEESVVEGSLLFEGVRVGKGCRLTNCIVDKNVIIPDRERIGYEMEKDRKRFTVSEKGIVVVPKGYKF